MGFLIGMGGGVNARVACHIGEKDTEAVRRTIHTSAIVCLLTGIFLMITGFTFSRGLLLLLNTKDELIDGAVLYLRIYTLGLPAMAIYNFGNAVFSADGETKKPLIFLTVSGFMNILLNLFFVIVCKMSVAGVALATVITQYLAAVLIIASLMKQKGEIKLSLSHLRADRQTVHSVVTLGLPGGFHNSIFAIANLFIQSGVNRFDAVTVEGHSDASNADGLIYDVMAAFYIACSSFISQNLGARKKDRIKKSYLISLAYSFCAGAILGVLLLIFGRQFLSLFTSDEVIISAGMQKILVMSLSYAISSFMDCAIAASRGLGKSLVPTVIVIMGSCVFRVIWIYTVFAFFGTLPSLYLLYVFSWSITAIAETVYFVRCYKKVPSL